MTLTWTGAPDLPQVPFGRLFRRLDRAVPEGSGIVTAYTDGQVTLRSNRTKIGYHEAADLSSFKGIEVGDFVVHGLDILRGSVGIADSAGAITSVCTVCEPLVDLDLRYVAHVIRVQAKSGFTRALARGIREGGADFRRWGTLAELPIPMPPAEYQRAIADYLDRETARIDTLIEEQLRLIELLRTRRLDLIRAAVLGSANPFSPPPEVAFTAIGHHFSVTLGKMLDAGKTIRPSDQTLPYIRAGNIQDAGLKLDDVNRMPYSEAEAANLNLLRGDLLVVEGGAVGTNVLLLEDMNGWSFQKTVNRVRPLIDWSSGWLGYVLRTYRDIGVLDIVCNKSTIPHLTAEKLRAMRVPSVDPTEQVRVEAILDRETAKIDGLIAETNRFIELSKERRSALITAAVTGQIDVRETV